MVRSRGTPGESPTGKRVIPLSWWRLELALLSAGLSVVGAVSGCGSDRLKPPDPVDRSELYWTLDLNHHAVALESPREGALYDTLTLVATPRTVDGAPLDELPAPTYVSADPEKVAIASDGVLRARAATAPGEIVPVVATLTAGNLKHIDTVLVTVLAVDPPPVLASFSIHPTPNNAGYADSAKIGDALGSTTCFALPTWTQVAFNCSILLAVTVLDARGDSIPGVPVAFRSSDEDAALVTSAIDQVEPGKILLGRRQPLGQVAFYASTTVFGVAKADTLLFRIGWPVLFVLDAGRTGFTDTVVKVGAGATVIWYSTEPFNIDVNFADPTNVASVGQPRPSFYTRNQLLRCDFFAPLCDEAGNAVLTPNQFGESWVFRRFPVPGTYDYSSTALGGAGGRIIVLDEP